MGENRDGAASLADALNAFIARQDIKGEKQTPNINVVGTKLKCVLIIYFYVIYLFHIILVLYFHLQILFVYLIVYIFYLYFIIYHFLCISYLYMFNTVIKTLAVKVVKQIIDELARKQAFSSKTKTLSAIWERTGTEPRPSLTRLTLSQQGKTSKEKSRLQT